MQYANTVELSTKSKNPYRRFAQQFLILVSFAFGLIFTAERCHAVEDPIAMLKGVTSRVMAELRTNREALRQNPGRIYDMVNHLIIPYTDFVEMGKWVVGRNAWNAANEATHQAFMNEFKTLVVRTYASSLLAYTDQTLEFLPLRGGYEGKERIQVSSLIRDQGKSPFRLDYRLVKQGDKWKVYDIIIEGVSLMQGYHSQFAEDVRAGGLAQVVQRLKQHNASRGSR